MKIDITHRSITEKAMKVYSSFYSHVHALYSVLLQ